MVNDSKTGNCVMKKIVVAGKPHLCLFVVRSLKPGEELRYNYGDDKNLFWRDKVKISIFFCHGVIFLFNLQYLSCDVDSIMSN